MGGRTVPSAGTSRYPRMAGNAAAVETEKAAGPEPQAIFADQDGVQVFWGQPWGELTRLVYPLESEIGLRQTGAAPPDLIHHP